MAGKGIPTWHARVLFRSRTEARWALFFDKLHVKWEYETQGFVTDGEPYLPDFAVFAALGTLWVEIKPAWDNDPEGIARFRRFAAQRPQPSRAVLLVGIPGEDSRTLVIGGDDSGGDPVNASWEDDTQEWRPCPSGHHFDLAYPGTFRAKFAEDGCPDKFGGLGEEAIADAITAARSARFDGKPAPGPETAT
jgi:hypothetical protein